MNKEEQTKRSSDARRRRLEADTTGEYRAQINKNRDAYRRRHDHADRSRTRRPKREWLREDIQRINDRDKTDKELAIEFCVSVSAVQMIRWRIKRGEINLDTPEKRKP